MKTPDEHISKVGPTDEARGAREPSDEAPDVPGFRTWGGVYGFAFAVFVGVVVALTFFTRAFA